MLAMSLAYGWLAQPGRAKGPNRHLLGGTELIPTDATDSLKKKALGPQTMGLTRSRLGSEAIGIIGKCINEEMK